MYTNQAMIGRLTVSKPPTVSNRAPHIEATLTTTNEIYCEQTMQSFCTLRKKLDGCTVSNAHNTVLGEEALLIYIVPVCYVKTGM